ncbi:MAG: hypothetical protein QM758_28680 [Armatimonas sp.]
MHVPPGRNVVFCLSALRRQAASNETSSLPIEEPVQEQEVLPQGESAGAEDTPTEAEIAPQEAEIQEDFLR